MALRFQTTAQMHGEHCSCCSKVRNYTPESVRLKGQGDGWMLECATDHHAFRAAAAPRQGSNFHQSAVLELLGQEIVNGKLSVRRACCPTIRESCRHRHVQPELQVKVCIANEFSTCDWSAHCTCCMIQSHSPCLASGPFSLHTAGTTGALALSQARLLVQPPKKLPRQAC